MNNGSDRLYLFREGKPTETFFWTHGELSSQQAKLLKSHAALETSDWYFNRAIYNVMVAIGDELTKAEAVRTRDYWLASARKRMTIWKKITGGSVRTFARRGLVRYPRAPDVQLMLSLSHADEREGSDIYKQLLRLARLNDRTLAGFLRAKDKAGRLAIIRDAEANSSATAPLLDVLKKNATRL